MNFKKLIQELKRRNVFKVAGVYAVASWVLIQIAATIFPFFKIPDWGVRLVVGLVILGFPIALILAWAFEMTPDGVKRTGEVPEEHSITTSTGKKLNNLFMIILILAVSVLSYKQFFEKQPVSAHDNNRQSEMDSLKDQAKSIAVLPFSNDSGDPKQRYFSDGLSENLIIALSQYPKLTVIGRNSSFQLRNTKLDSKQIGNKLNVGTLLEGSVSHEGNEVRIRAELVSADNGRTIWSDYYDRPYKNLFNLQDDITKAVTKALKTKLLGNLHSNKIAAQTDRPPSGSLVAYNAYLEGNFYFNHFSQDSWRKAISYYRKAISVDPKYAAAYAKLSAAWQSLGAGFLGGSERQKAYQKAGTAVDTALVLNPNLAVAYMAHGSLLLDLMNWQGARRAIQRAVSLAPSNPSAKGLLAVTSATLGNITKALQYGQEAVAANPLDARIYYNLSEYYTSLGQFSKAEKTINRAIAMQPGATAINTQLTIVQIFLGNDKAALTAARKEPAPAWRSYALALAYTANGEKKQANQALQKMISKYADLATYQIAEVYAYRQQPDKAFKWLNRAWQQKDPGLTGLLWDPFMLRYKNDPRFISFCNKIGLSVPDHKDTTMTTYTSKGN
ncbi:MAG TPA: tetratricopeptide repeat protein [Balneolales bacterium]|nr:tetratricopeptide repeat protein [Balneolales bacterium]